MRARQCTLRWAWFSLNFYAYDPDPTKPNGLAGLNGNLFDYGSGALTPLGETFASFTKRLNQRTVNLAIAINSDVVVNRARQSHVSHVCVIVTNHGDAAATGFRLRRWQDNQPLATFSITTSLLPHCGYQIALPLRWLMRPQSTETTLSTSWQLQMLLTVE